MLWKGNWYFRMIVFGGGNLGNRLVGEKRTLKTGKLRNLNSGSSNRSTDDESRKDIEGGMNRMGDRDIWCRGQISGEREIECPEGF